jgi:hypothetical protein
VDWACVGGRSVPEVDPFDLEVLGWTLNGNNAEAARLHAWASDQYAEVDDRLPI